MTNVEVGQLWTDNDPRSAGRVVQVVRKFGETGDQVRVLVVRNARSSTNDTIGSPRYIHKDRFKPTSRGYRLIQHADGTKVEGEASIDSYPMIDRMKPW